MLLISGCQASKTESEIKKLSGRRIHFPEHYEIITSHNITVSESPINKKYKIVTYINENICSVCALKLLTDWQYFMQYLGRDVGFVAIAYPGDKESLASALTELDISLPILYDVDNSFLSLNRLEHIRARCRTFLLDGQNRVILVGEPLNSPKLKGLYKATIQSLYEEP